MLKKIAKLKHSNTNVFKYANCDKITDNQMTGYHSNCKQNFKVDKNHNLFYILTRVNKCLHVKKLFFPEGSALGFMKL